MYLCYLWTEGYVKIIDIVLSQAIAINGFHSSFA